jgi:xylulose-5-phosphate/fructose-6-phosphate phosphoketolase
MIVLRTPKGWTGPKFVDGKPVEGTFRAHQVPITDVKTNEEHLKQLEDWMKSYHPETLFDEHGRFIPELAQLAPQGDRRMGANPHANGGKLTVDLNLPAYAEYAIDVPRPATVHAESTRRLGTWLRDVFVQNKEQQNFRITCPDETNSNRLMDVFEVENRTFEEKIIPIDDHLAQDGRVMEVLSEHLCHGWLEGYSLTGRHGMFVTYESFAMVSASQTVQYSKWLEEGVKLSWRAPVPSMNILLTSTCWRNDHNGFSHQGPGLIDTVLTQRGAVSRIYLPPDANCLLSVADHCLRSKDYVNLIVIDKQPQLQWLNMHDAMEHCARGLSKWQWASNDGEAEPDVVLGCAGDIPTMEIVAAAWWLRKHLPDLKVRVTNVVDLMTLFTPDNHPHGVDNETFVDVFTEDKPVIFGFHGYQRAIHEIVHGRPHAERFHVRGFNEQGTTTTPFNMVVLNGMSRYHLVKLTLQYTRHVPVVGERYDELVAECDAMLAKSHDYSYQNFEDLPEIRDWVWTE